MRGRVCRRTRVGSCAAAFGSAWALLVTAAPVNAQGTSARAVHGLQVFNSPGTYTWTLPASLGRESVYTVFVWSAGGGGAGGGGSRAARSRWISEV